jgi:hypothetical protein
MGKLVQLKNVRLSFPSIFEATDYQGDSNFKYRAQFIFDRGSANEKLLRSAIDEVTQELWGDKAKSILKKVENTNFFCLREGDSSRPDDPAYAGKMFVSATNDKRPKVVDRDNSVLAKDDEKPYAGCYVNAFIEIYAYGSSPKSKAKSTGVSAALKAVQFFRDGEAFTGGVSNSELEFEEVGDEDFADLVA